MSVRQFPSVHQFMHDRFEIELEPLPADPCSATGRFDWLLLSFWVGYSAVYIGTAWTVLRWATMPAGA